MEVIGTDPHRQDCKCLSCEEKREVMMTERVTSALVTSAKAHLRKIIKDRIGQMTAEQKRQQSAIVTNKILASEVYKKAERISLYLSTENEISTYEIMVNILKSGKTCFVPRYEKTKMEMLRLHSLEDYEALPMTKWNIKQPEISEGRDEALSTGGLDLILVPGVAFSRTGFRLGHGKGYYDKYIEECKKMNPEGKLLTIVGLAFREQIEEEIPTLPHDVPTNWVVSPD